MIPLPQEHHSTAKKTDRQQSIRARMKAKAQTRDEKKLHLTATQLDTYITNPEKLKPEELSQLTTNLQRSVLIINKQKNKNRGIN